MYWITGLGAVKILLGIVYAVVWYTFPLVFYWSQCLNRPFQKKVRETYNENKPLNWVMTTLSIFFSLVAYYLLYLIYYIHPLYDYMGTHDLSAGIGFLILLIMFFANQCGSLAFNPWLFSIRYSIKNINS